MSTLLSDGHMEQRIVKHKHLNETPSGGSDYFPFPSYFLGQTEGSQCVDLLMKYDKILEFKIP